MRLLDLNISNITSEKFENELPELYELKTVVENSRQVHQHDSVFDHTLRVYEKLSLLLSERRFPELDETIGGFTRKDLLLITALFHDLGKKETITIKNGFTSCPNHEVISTEKTAKILSRFEDVDEKAKIQILYLVRHHGAFFEIVKSNNPTREQDVQDYLKGHRDYLPELILHAMADIMGSQLEQTYPEEYDFRIKELEKLLDKC